MNPSGKLPITFPASVNRFAAPGHLLASATRRAIFTVDYTEGFLVGYKWYDAKGITPQFPFGFGLSYTTFSFSNVAL